VTIPGIHHVTAMASDPQRNLDFYTGVLGLRLVKLTVNFDDPGTYHFYYGDQEGTPGTIMTFFPWPGSAHGHVGAGQVSQVGFAVPSGGMDHWVGTLQRQPDSDGALRFTDPDGLPLRIEPTGEGEGHAIQRFANVTLTETETAPTADLLTSGMGFQSFGNNSFRSANDAVHVNDQPEARAGRMGAGTVHHVAFRAETDARQLEWRQILMKRGLHVTEVLDREYFHSIYFREPGGVLFEIATDPPGFAIDELPAELGIHLKLPPWLEPNRAEIERKLPNLRLPAC
jgi:glyoxalase family protein